MKSKRIFLGLLLVLFIMALLPVSILAASTATQKITMLPVNQADLALDTSNPEIGLAFFIEDEMKTSGYQTTQKTGYGYFYFKQSGDIIANFSCTGYFSYSGDICNVLDVDTSVWETIEGWRVEVEESVKQISPTYARATGVFDLYNNDTLSSSATINIYCNQKDDTSVEFNGD
ncbi:MAG: hypothetical protein WAP19_00275 [Caldicoprobacterales bacterium]